MNPSKPSFPQRRYTWELCKIFKVCFKGKQLQKNEVMAVSNAALRSAFHPYICLLPLGSVPLKLLSNFRLPWPEASGSWKTLGYSFCWKHTDVLKPFEMMAHFLQVAALHHLAIETFSSSEILEDTVQPCLSFKQGPMESVLQKQDLNLWVTLRFFLCSAFCSSYLISRRQSGAVDIRGLLILNSGRGDSQHLPITNWNDIPKA